MSNQDFARKLLKPVDYFAISLQPADSNRPGGGGYPIHEKVTSDFPEGGRKYFRRSAKCSSLDALILLVAQVSPPNPVCIPKNTERLVFLWIRPHAQNVPIEVFDLHLQRPLEILRRVPDLGARRNILTVQRAHILHPDPYPHARLALVVISEKNGAFVSRDAGRSFVRAPAQLEAKGV